MSNFDWGDTARRLACPPFEPIGRLLPCLRTVKLSCNDVIHYLHFNGDSYGSERLFIWHEERVRLYGAVAARFSARTGGCCLNECLDLMRAREKDPVVKCDPDYRVAKVCWTYCGLRKYGYENLRDGKPIVLPGNGKAGLLSGPEKIGAILYAYLGINANVKRRVLKLGYTAKPIKKYLASLSRQYDPWLLATYPGTEDEENQLRTKWRRLLVDGREWFEPDKNILRWLYENFRPVPGFWGLVKRLRKEAERGELSLYV